MDRSIGAFYVAIFNNEVVIFDTNLKNFVEQLSKIEPEAKNYDWFFRRFKKFGPYFNYSIGDKEYYFQKLI